MLNRKKKNNKGFTLVELLVVIAIIGVLAVVAVPSLFNNINKSKAAKIESDYSTIRTAVMSEYADGTTIDEIVTKNTSGLNIEGIKDSTKYVIAKGSNGTVLQLTITTDDAAIATKVATDLGGTPNGVNVTIPLITDKITS